MTGNTIDELNEIDPNDLTPDDIDAIIAIHRQRRAEHEAGIKAPRAKGQSQKLDMIKLGLTKAPPAIKRRF